MKGAAAAAAAAELPARTRTPRSARSAGRRCGCAGCARSRRSSSGTRQQLGEAWRELAAETRDADEFARRWRETARTWSFAQVNELIERHNRNFPAEARLPMDPRTRDFVKINGKPYQREPLDARVDPRALSGRPRRRARTA